MIRANLPKSDSEKIAYSIRLYQDTLDQLSSVADATGINLPNLIRISINNLLDSDDVKEALEG